MAAAGCDIAVDMAQLTEGLAVVAEQVDGWPEGRAVRFWREWRELEAHGAEMVDVGFVYGKIWAVMSNDMRQHLARFGVLV